MGTPIHCVNQDTNTWVVFLHSHRRKLFSRMFDQSSTDDDDIYMTEFEECVRDMVKEFLRTRVKQVCTSTDWSIYKVISFFVYYVFFLGTYRVFMPHQKGPITTTYTGDWFLGEGECRGKLGEWMKKTSVRSQDQRRMLQVTTVEHTTFHPTHGLTKLRRRKN